MQCTAAAPELPEEVRALLPAGVEEVLFKLLEKSADARPASSAEVVAQLSPFVSAASRASRGSAVLKGEAPPRASGAGAASRTTERPATAEVPAPARQSGGDTLISTPHPAIKRADTVDLVERATQPKQISTAIAVALILLLSLVAGLTAYVLRLRVGAGVGQEAAAAPARGQAVSAPRR
jgi:serine/threonine-protein kinase